MGGRFKTGQHHQTSGFAGSGRAQHGKKFAAGHIHIEVFDDKSLTIVALLNVCKTNKRIIILGHNTPFCYYPVK